ncbi:MAG: NADH-quinone oxidoreductase subunit J [Prevotellaceae bacterium]|jgi:NADH-quinone oxidoreductase subunit J|nr:NADH-quinone oxidoreductase subunit J [Prevotellaceae bacterium]
MNIIFWILAAVIAVCSILTVTTKRILRAATYLLFVLFATAGIYFLLNYSFLGAVQLTVYAGGIIILYVFSIFLTSTTRDEQKAKLKTGKLAAGLLTALAGAAICIFLILTHSFGATYPVGDEVQMSEIGTALLGTGKYQYLLPFEAIGVLLLAGIIGGILIARKR